MIFVISGPGGAGKGTIVSSLLARDERLWLSRSWTTRARRPSEPADAYHFVDRATFEAQVERDGFLEWAEVVPGQFSGTPEVEAPPGRDAVYEINVEGARQVKRHHPDAVVVFVVAPSREVQAERQRARGDDEEAVATRLALTDWEERQAEGLADHVLVNDDLNRAVDELAGIIAAHRDGRLAVRARPLDP